MQQEGPLIAAHIEPAMGFFDALRRETRDGPGVTRTAYGPGEQAAHRLARGVAEQLGLECENDFAGNLYMTLPGRSRTAKRLVIGSHLDSVVRGGNYDGAAGVAAGLAAVATLKRAGTVPSCDVTVMAIRAEEGVWFPYSYVGSSMALGRLPGALVDKLKRSDTGRSLASHIGDLGFDAEVVRRGESHLSTKNVAAFIEPHIEQGPILEAKGLPLGVVTGIRGNFRYRRAHCLGAYGHSGAVPRTLRQDAVAAACDLVVHMNSFWKQLEDAGEDLSITFGKFSTDAKVHAFSTIAGEVEFAVDVRSLVPATLERLKARLLAAVQAVEAERKVRFRLDDYSDAPPAEMNARLREALMSAARNRGIAFAEMASGAGHDAVAFATAGIPTAMLFIRNSHGSHNPEEEMSEADFGDAVSVLADFLAAYEDTRPVDVH